MQTMPPEKNQQWLPVILIAGALAAWGVLLAVGAWLAPGGDEARQGDFRKLWVVAGMVGGFLLLWGGALAVRARKVRRQLSEREKQ
jgi:hypothetical protein